MYDCIGTEPRIPGILIVGGVDGRNGTLLSSHQADAVSTGLPLALAAKSAVADTPTLPASGQEESQPPTLIPRSISAAAPSTSAYLDKSISKSRYRSAHTLALDVGVDWTASRSHSLHTLVPRLGGFPAGLARWAIETYSRPDSTVLDPFCGKGTAPLEALLATRYAAGNDASPDAFIITHAKLSGVTHSRATAFLESLRLSDQADFGSAPEDVRLFFHEDTLRQILRLRSALFRTLRIDPGQIEGLAKLTLTEEQKAAIYVLACLLGCLHGPVDYRRNREGASQNIKGESLYLSVHCNHTYSAAPGYVKKYCAQHGLRPPLRDVMVSILRKSALAQSDGVPEVFGEALCGPAEGLAWNRHVDLVVTSPPYFRAQTYAWDNWLRLWCLGYGDYRQVERTLLHTGSIPRYFAGILASLTRVKALLSKRGAYVVVVVGDVATRSKASSDHQPFLGQDERIERYISYDESKGLVINTSEIVADAGRNLGLDVELIVNDLVPRRNRALASILKHRHGAAVDRIIVLRSAAECR